MSFYHGDRQGTLPCQRSDPLLKQTQIVQNSRRSSLQEWHQLPSYLRQLTGIQPQVLLNTPHLQNRLAFAKALRAPAWQESPSQTAQTISATRQLPNRHTKVHL